MRNLSSRPLMSWEHSSSSPKYFVDPYGSVGTSSTCSNNTYRSALSDMDYNQSSAISILPKSRARIISKRRGAIKHQR